MTSTEELMPALALEQAGARDAIRELVHTAVHEAIEREFARFLGALRPMRGARRAWAGGMGAMRDPARPAWARSGATWRATWRATCRASGRGSSSRRSRHAVRCLEQAEQALVLAMAEMYCQGVSTRKVTEVVEGLEVLCGTSVRASEVSVLARKLDVALTAWRQRRLNDVRDPYLIVDAMVERVRRAKARCATRLLST